MDNVQKRDTLGRSIGALAKQKNEPVFFHAFKDPVGGAPVILLECSEAFLQMVEKLPGCTNIHKIELNFATERSPELWSYFTNAAPKFSQKHSPNP
jgi:hypothetical protein